MRNSKSSAALLGLCALILSTGAAIAAAQDPPAPTQPNPETPPNQSTPMTPPQPVTDKSELAVAGVQTKFDALDTNHDGFIDQAEAAASDVLAGQFATLDASGDGKLSLAEFTSARNLASIRIDHRNHQE
ncbi:MAG TPA: EF-hand domain-containing protein [Rudaea sp.]